MKQREGRSQANKAYVRALVGRGSRSIAPGGTRWGETDVEAEVMLEHVGVLLDDFCDFPSVEGKEDKKKKGKHTNPAL